MSVRGHGTYVYAGLLLLICGTSAIIALTTIWWTSDSDEISAHRSRELTLWEMNFGYAEDKYITAKHQLICENSKGVLAAYCSKIRSAQATTIMTAIFGIVQAYFSFWFYCKPRIWLLVTCLIIGFFTLGSAISSMALGVRLTSDNSLISTPGTGYICVCIATVFALVAYVLNIVGSFLGPKGGSGSGGCNKCFRDRTFFGSKYGGHRRFGDRTPVSAPVTPKSGRTPVGGNPIGFHMPAVAPQKTPYWAPVPPPQPQPRQPPPQQINLNIEQSSLHLKRAAGPPASGGWQAPPSNSPAPVVYRGVAPPASGGWQAPPSLLPGPVIYRGDDFGITSRE